MIPPFTRHLPCELPSDFRRSDRLNGHFVLRMVEATAGFEPAIKGFAALRACARERAAVLVVAAESLYGGCVCRVNCRVGLA